VMLDHPSWVTNPDGTEYREAYAKPHYLLARATVPKS
jgi:hypothetical protein